MSTAPERVVVVGASLAGTRTAEALRAEGFQGRISVVGAEPHLPYDRPPLSKQMLTRDWDERQVRFQSEDHYRDLEVELRLGDPATGIDPERREVLLAGGERLGFDALVVATGSAARPLTDRPPAGVHLLRSLDDCLRLRAELRDRPRVVVVGGGFIGAEVAASARARELEVTWLVAEQEPLAGALGTELGSVFAAVHRENGVVVRTGVVVTGFRGTRRVEGVVLADGAVVPADVVVLGIGATPNTGWLVGSGLPVRDGLVCDEHCAVDAELGVYAAGDVARWPNGAWGEDRVQHWTNAVEQARQVAFGILGKPRPYLHLPYFWTDQYDLKIQLVGRCLPGCEMRVVHGSPEQGSFVAAYRRGGRVTGAVACNAVRELVPYRRMLAGGPASVEEPTASG
ncbi:FAD-dependent oxidoreductase [Saccharopolyspora sp. K220]|uniref:NAD(P)/FAD-dependent oxidoreductase n=1 Tax=Saccharopolyspora soli TaxID=2926618 RepID=UPI001F572274|nr:FAD-dependent oxidoreductase [Saccharopolyspora soli]MCI2423762.1 FAD-dependent oxidoreductase [Saccharopolyspora soli]